MFTSALSGTSDERIEAKLLAARVSGPACGVAAPGCYTLSLTQPMPVPTFCADDASKVDRSAAYATRHIAKNFVASGICSQVLVQVAYAIGVAQPVGLFVNTYGTCKIKGLSDSEIAHKLLGIFDLRPAAIVKRFGLKNPIFSETAAYGHFGREPQKKTVQIGLNGKTRTKPLPGKNSMP